MQINDLWEVRALPILRAVHEARERGADLGRAAKDAVPDLTLDQYKDTVWHLTEDGYLDTAIQRGGGDRMNVFHMRGITAKGLRAIGAWPSQEVADELLRLLRVRIENETEPEKKRLLMRLLEAATDVGKAVLSDVLAKVATRGM